MADTQTRQVEDVHGSGIYPGSGPRPSGDAMVRTPAQLGHPEVPRYRAPGSLRALEKTSQLIGRTIFGGYFIYNGLNHFQNHAMMTEYARSKGVPAPGAAVAVSGAMILAGGLSIVTGLWPKVGAGLVWTFLAGVTPRMHAFWKETDQQARMTEMINFTKNVALAGAACMAAGQSEPWPLSLGRASKA
jgi:putative oxidoreductase